MRNFLPSRSKNERNPIAGVISCCVLSLFFVVAGTCGAKAAGSGAAQDDNRKLTLSFENASIREVLKKIDTQTDYTFFYGEGTISLAEKKVTASFRDKSLTFILDAIFKDSGLKYSFEKKVIVVSAVKKEPKPVQRIITGKVTDRENGQPMQGVTVMLKNHAVGVATDAKGEYSFRLPAGVAKGTLVFSFIGKETREMPLAENRDVVNVVLYDSATSMDNVVVTGIARIAKSSFTGNAVRVEREELMRVNPDNMIGALQVFDPSFRIMENINMGSNPNAVPEFYIRGQTGMGVTELDRANLTSSSMSGSNINNPNLPIFILDDFEVDVEKIMDLDMNLIHSVTILKDAAATAMWGSRAANGVIIVETKDPEPGKLRVTYNGRVAVETPDLSSYNLMNAREKLEAERLSGLYDSNTPGVDPYTNEYYRRYNNVIGGVDTYWLSQGLRNGVSQSHSIQVSGGEQDVRWGVNLNANLTNGVMKRSSRNVYGAEFFIYYRLSNFRINNKASFTNTIRNEQPYNSFEDYSHLLPYNRLYDAHGNYVRNLEFSSGSYVNPLYEMQNMKSIDRGSTSTFINNLAFDWDIVKGLRMRGTFSAQFGSGDSKLFRDPESAYYLNTPGQNRGEMSLSDTRNTVLDGLLTLNYNASLGDHNINAGLSYNVRQSDSKMSSRYLKGFPNGSGNPVEANDWTSKPGFSNTKSRLMGYVLTGNYTYKDTYLLDLQGRADGSSNFGADRRWSFFWSTGVGLNLHKYKFMNKQKVISFLKLRATYGVTGKTDFSATDAKDLYAYPSGYNYYPTGYGYFLSQMGNRGLKWERKLALDYGMDLRFFDDRIHFDLSFYNETTKDLITSFTLQSSTGFTSYKNNMGSVKNTGVEIMVRANVLQTKTWNLILFGNFSRNKNRIVNISNAMKAYNERVIKLFENFDPESSTSAEYAHSYIMYEEGYSLTSITGMKSLGISPSNGREIFLLKNGDVTDKWSPREWQVIGNSEPKGRGSFGFTLSWRRFMLSTSFMYSFGGDAYNYTLVNYVENADIARYNVDKRVLMDRWQKPGDRTSLKDIKARNNTTGATSRFVQKENYLTFNSADLSYEINPKLLEKMKISMCRISANVNELFYFSSIRRERGLSYPFARKFSLSLTLSF